MAQVLGRQRPRRFYCTREALRIMEPRKSGKIINIASLAGTAGFSAFLDPAYCATKGAVLALDALGRGRGGGWEYLRQRHRRRPAS